LVAVSVALLVATGGPLVNAQNEDVLRFFRFDREQMRKQRAAPSGPAIIRVPGGEPKQARRPKPKTVPSVVVQDTPETPKIAPTVFVAVLGDTLGEALAAGLSTEFAARPEISVLRKTRGSSGLVRDDFHDWPKVIDALLAGDEKITLAVMLIGSNDKQPIRVGGESHEPGSERWTELYRLRVQRIVRTFAAKGVPLVWVGLPAMQNARYAADMLALNDIYRAEVQRGGGHWVDLWEAFVDSQGRFASHGPDIAGQIARLRAGDGIHFTKAGGQKAAHFVELAVSRIIGRPDGLPALAISPSATPPPATAPPIAPNLSTPSQPPTIVAKPAAGPIQSLAPGAAAPDAALAGTAADPELPADDTIARRVLIDGVPISAKPGRADDHAWPK
jgi:hypothetical protein